VENEAVQEVSFKMPLEIYNGEIEELSLYLANTEGIDRKDRFAKDTLDKLNIDLWAFLFKLLDESPALRDIIRRKYRDENCEATPAQMDQVDRQLAKMAAKYQQSEADKLWGESYRDFITVAPIGGKP
jgi:hypothetical protein